MKHCNRMIMVVWMILEAGLAQAGERYALDVFPTEQQKMVDEQTGAELTFISTDPAWEHNLYFHEWSWLADGSMVLFYSKREKGGLMGYLTATGELVRLNTPSGALGNASAAVDRNSVYATRGRDAVELALEIEPSGDPAKQPSRVWATERFIATLPEGSAGALNPNCNGKWVACGVFKGKGGSPAKVIRINLKSGAVKTVCEVPENQEFSYHVQWSHENPNLLSFAAIYPRINVVDVRNGRVQNPYRELPGELVTHEHWWVDDQIAFCGGLHLKPLEDSHVKLLDIHTGQIRILGAGAWWEGATPEQLGKCNHWHCAGSDDGRWVVSDNWHGDLWLHEGKTARSFLLTQGHRTYGKGDHPEMGWDRKGEQLVFCSHKLGNPNVCIVKIPKNLQDANLTPKREKSK